MKATAKFADPAEAEVTIVLTGQLREFEALDEALRDAGVPFYRTQALVDQIRDAARKLRGAVHADEPGEQGLGA